MKKTLVPLDTCNHVQLTLQNFRAIKNKQLQKVLVKMVQPYIKNLVKDAGVKAALMYDPLTVFYLLDKNACKSYEDNVQVETKGEITRGMTVVDKRIVTDNLPPNMIIVTHIPQIKFQNSFIHTLSR